MSSGIYQITNQINGHRYVGSAVNIRKRWREHLGSLRRGQHENQHLQRSFEKYGEPAFAFCVVEAIQEISQLIPREQYFLNTLKPEYNVSRKAGSPMLGRHHTAETRRQMRKAWTPERRQMWSQGQSGERNHNYGKHASEQTKRKMSDAHKGIRFTDEHRRNISVAWTGQRNPMYGKHHSQQARSK